MGTGTYRLAANGGGLADAVQIAASVNGGVRRSFFESFDLSLATVDNNTGTINLCARIPQGHSILSIKVKSTVSLTTSTLAFGTVADPDRFGTAKVYGTTPDAEIDFLLTAQKGIPLEAAETVNMTIAAANLPAAGIVTVDIETSSHG